jgi:hypothetical protein
VAAAAAATAAAGLPLLQAVTACLPRQEQRRVCWCARLLGSTRGGSSAACAHRAQARVPATHASGGAPAGCRCSWQWRRLLPRAVGVRPVACRWVWTHVANAAAGVRQVSHGTLQGLHIHLMHAQRRTIGWQALA